MERHPRRGRREVWAPGTPALRHAISEMLEVFQNLVRFPSVHPRRGCRRIQSNRLFSQGGGRVETHEARCGTGLVFPVCRPSALAVSVSWRAPKRVTASLRSTTGELPEKKGSTMASKQGFFSREAGGTLSHLVEALATSVKATLGVPGRMDGRETQDRAPAGPPGGAPGRQRPTGPRRYWPNPSSTEGGRLWPPAPPHWY